MSSNKEVDDILESLRGEGKKKKRVNSKRKGKRGERLVCPILADRFQRPFVKAPDDFGSGAWSTNNEEVQEGLDLDHMCGDIITPKGFKFSLEVKNGYDIELINLFPGANRERDAKLFDEFIEQSERDATRVGKSPLVIYKKDRCPFLVLVHKNDLGDLLPSVLRMNYKEHILLGLIDFLSLPDEYFFPKLPDVS